MWPVLRRALALLAVALLAAACTSGGPAAKGTTSTTTKGTTPTTTTVPPSLVANVTPPGWVPVDYGDAQISVPADWNVGYDAGCPYTQLPGTVLVGQLGNATCPSTAGAGSRPWVHLGPEPAVIGTGADIRMTVNGILVLRGPSGPAADRSAYVVPSLGVSLQLVGAEAQHVLATLTYSPRAHVLSGGPVPAVPSSWQRYPFAGISFAAPGDWQVRSIDYYGGYCGTPGVSALRSVTLSTDTRRIPQPMCPVAIPVLRPASDGIWVDAIADRAVPTPTGPAAHCLDLHGLSVCPYANPAFGILYLLVSGPRLPHDVMVEIGLAGDGTVARTILYSLRAA
jgi:hypothetical protein